MEFALNAPTPGLMTPAVLKQQESIMARNSERTALCRKQAAECAAAATATVLAEVKEAYLNLEQGWLQLAPEIQQPKPFSLICESSNADDDQRPEKDA
jgi:hypothetical protein